MTHWRNRFESPRYSLCPACDVVAILVAIATVVALFKISSFLAGIGQ